MATETIISTPQTVLLYHPDTKIIHHEFRQFVFGEQFRTVLLAGFDLMRERGACKWLSDDRGNSSLAQEDIDWSDAVWLPAVIDAGWRYWGVVTPSSVVGRRNIERWAAKFSVAGVTAKSFTDPDSALSWLERQE